MYKLKIKQPGYFVSIPSVGSFRSPFKIKVPDSLVDLVKASLLKDGVKDYEFVGVVEKQDESIFVSKKKEVEPEIRTKDSVDLTPILKRLDYIQSLVHEVLLKEPTVQQVIVRSEEVEKKKAAEEEQEMFVPTFSEKIVSIDLTTKTTEKGDISSRVESLSKLKD